MPELGREIRQAMCLHAEEYDVGIACLLQVIHDLRPDDEVIIRRLDANSILFHRAIVRSARKENNFPALAGYQRANVSAYRAGSGDDGLHFDSPLKAAATALRWILPVAVRGIVSTIWILFGRLKSARRSLQNARTSPSEAVPFNTMAAATSSPQVGCGTPKHTASEIAGCVSRTSSISRGEIFSPPRLMSSLMRATSWRYPSLSRMP